MLLWINFFESYYTIASISSPAPLPAGADNLVAGGDFLILSESEVVEPLHTGGSFLLRLTVEQGGCCHCHCPTSSQALKLRQVETSTQPLTGGGHTTFYFS